MITSIEVRNAIGTLVATIPIINPSPTSQYLVTDIKGLEPVKANIISSPYANQDGGFFQSAHTGGRNIVMTLAYQPDYINGTIESLRRGLYSIFPPKGLVKLRFFNDDTRYQTVEIDAWVESNLPAIFAKDPSVQISFSSPKPYFKELAPMVRTGITRTPLLLPYRGDADTGFLLEVVIYSDTTKVIINNNQVDSDIVVEFPSSNPLRMGDSLILSTVEGSKSLTQRRASAYINVLDNRTYGSLSMTLGPVVNSLNVDVVPIAGQSGIFPLTLTCTPAYVGL